jgi:hypothetical protein
VNQTQLEQAMANDTNVATYAAGVSLAPSSLTLLDDSNRTISHLNVTSSAGYNGKFGLKVHMRMEGAQDGQVFKLQVRNIGRGH